MGHARALRSGGAARLAADTSLSAPDLRGREMRTNAGARPVRGPLPGANATRGARLARRRSSGPVPQRCPRRPREARFGDTVWARVRLQRPGGTGIGTELEAACVAQPAVLLPSLHDLSTGRCRASARTPSRATRRQARTPSACAWLWATRNGCLLVVEPHVVLLAPAWHALRREPALLRARDGATAGSTRPRTAAGETAASALSRSAVSRSAVSR
jgi:hypothetical protein